MSNDILNAVQEYMINGHVSDAPFIINDYVITLERLDDGVRISATRGGQTESVVVYDGDLTNLNHEVLANRNADDQHPINAISGLRSELDSKQPVISDLEQIRTNAGKGATAVQHNELSNVAMTGSYNDLNGKPNLARVATSGSYNDLVDKPSMVLDHNNLTGRSGYNQHPMSSITGLIDNLNGKQGVIADLSEIRANARKANTAVQPSDLARVATTGSYNDLTDKPTVFGNEVEVGPTPEDADLWIDTSESGSNVDPSVRWDVEQSLTDAQKERARNNIGAASSGADIDPTLTDPTKAAPADVVGKLRDELEDHFVYKRYGVTGIGLSQTTLTRIYDAIGMVAQVGTDGDNSKVVNHFDEAAPFMRRKCVGEWHMQNGKPVFQVNAYYGDPDYTEDGSIGDYVAVDCPPAYYTYDQDGGTLAISSHRYDGYRPFDCLMDRETGDCREHTYLPCYALALKNGHAVSLPGLPNESGDYARLFNACKTADNDAASMAMLMPIAVSFYEWALYTVEFANTNCQSIMTGMGNMRHNNEDRIVHLEGNKWLYSGYSSAANREAGTRTYYSSFGVGNVVSIQPTNIDINAYNYMPSHRIVSMTRCDTSGNPSTSGLCNLFELEDLGIGREYVDGTEYRFAGRPCLTGACNGVSTPSGSPISNADGLHPMQYRWRENVFGDQYQTVADLMNYVVLQDGFANANANYAAKLEWLYHPRPETITPKNYADSAAGRDEMLANGWEILDVETPPDKYVSGYVKSRKNSKAYPDVWIVGESTGASASTYFADYAAPVHSNLLRAVRLGGNWNSGSYAGFSSANATHSLSSGLANFGGSLYYPQ